MTKHEPELVVAWAIQEGEEIAKYRMVLTLKGTTFEQNFMRVAMGSKADLRVLVVEKEGVDFMGEVKWETVDAETNAAAANVLILAYVRKHGVLENGAEEDEGDD